MTQFLVYDIETLGEAPPAAVIELGWMSVDFDAPNPSKPTVTFGNLEGEMLFGIPEGQVMTADNRAVHHISPQNLQGLAPFDVREFESGLDDVEYLVAHNAEFEMMWLDPLGLPWICTYKCALRAWPDAPSHGNQALKYWLDHEDSPAYYPPHRALPDAKVTAQHLYRLLLEHPVETLLQWSREPRLLPTCPIGKFRGKPWSAVEWGFLNWMLKQADMGADLKWNASREIDRRRAPPAPTTSVSNPDRSPAWNPNQVRDGSDGEE